MSVVCSARGIDFGPGCADRAAKSSHDNGRIRSEYETDAVRGDILSTNVYKILTEVVHGDLVAAPDCECNEASTTVAVGRMAHGKFSIN